MMRSLSLLKFNSVDTDILILPLVENVTTSDNLDALEIVSFLERSNRLNFASPKTFPASLE